MERQTAFPAWLIVLLIIAGIATTIILALLLTRLDSLQRQSLLPQEPLEIVDQEATLAASDLTVVVIAVEDVTGTVPPQETVASAETAVAPPTATSTPFPPTAIATAVSPTVPSLIPGCTFLPGDWVPYFVQKEDSLAILALRYGVSVGTLVKSNCLKGESLLPGQTIFVPLIVPTRATRIACGVPQDWVQYTMKNGDTLFKLAQQRNTTVSLIMQANCLDTTFLEAGSRLYVPPLPPGQLLPDSHEPSNLPSPQPWSGSKPESR